MVCVKFKKEPPFAGYRLYQMDNIEMCILGRFLSSDVRSRSSSFREWLFLDQEDTGSNITYLEKKGDEIWLSDLYSEEDPPLHYCKLTREQFLYILDTWEKLYKEGPEEIILTKDGDTITMEGKGKRKNIILIWAHQIWIDFLGKIRFWFS